MVRGLPFVRLATFCALLALSLQLQVQPPPAGMPLPGRLGHVAPLTTAGKLVFGGVDSDIMTYDVATAKPLWHSRIGAVSNALETYLLDGHQYLLTMAGDTLFAFTTH